MSPGEVPVWVVALGWSLVHFLWQGALVGLGFAVARALIPREHGALRYASGLLALGVLAVCPLATFVGLLPDAVVVAGLEAPTAGVAPVAVAAAMPAPSGLGRDGILPVLVAAWLAGVLVLFTRAVLQWRALERIANRLAWRDDAIDAMLRSVATRIGGLSRVRVLISRHIDTPTLIGWFNPVILLPTAVALGFPRQQLELILAHELGHLRRLDHLVNLGQAVVETLLFYHPVVHWISREVRHEREVCCDHLVLRLTDSEPREYARTLAALEGLRQMSPQLVVAASGGMLLDRVRRIIGSSSSSSSRESRRRPRIGAWLVTLVAAGSLTVAALVSRRDAPPPAIAFTYPAVSATWRADTAVIADLGIDAIAKPAWERLPPLRASADDAAAKPPSLEAPAPFVTDAVTRVEVPALPPALVPELIGNVPLDVADLAVILAGAGSPEVEAPVVPARDAPRLVRRVDPVYPDINLSGSRGHVEFEFAIDDAGHVRDINVVSGDSLGAFAVAARRALRQWRFAPHRARAHAGERFRQDFVFVGVTPKVAVSDDPICLRGTGSHLCRPARDTGVTTEVDVAEPQVATRSLAGIATRPSLREKAQVPALQSGADAPLAGTGGGTN